MAISTGSNSGTKATKSVPTYHGTKGKTALPQKGRKAPHDSATNGSGKSGKG